MPKYIDAEALRAVIKYVLDLIDEAPAADVVQVVRCKDCYMHGNCYTEEVFGFAGMTDGFCCVGKRRDENENA